MSERPMIDRMLREAEYIYRLREEIAQWQASVARQEAYLRDQAKASNAFFTKATEVLKSQT